MNYLGIDFGLAHIGLALSEGTLAEPLTQLSAKPLDQLISKLQTIIVQEQIDTIVIGISEGEMAERTKEFGELIRKVCSRPVLYVDETLTSQLAQEYLITGGAKRKKRQTKEHQVAAATILQAFLDALPST